MHPVINPAEMLRTAWFSGPGRVTDEEAEGGVVDGDRVRGGRFKKERTKRGAVMVDKTPFKKKCVVGFFYYSYFLPNHGYVPAHWL